MPLPPTPPITQDPIRLIRFLVKKCAKWAFKWASCISIGVIAWILFDPLPPAFMWSVIVVMLGSMTIHTMLHQKGVRSGFAKQACRLAFFASIPMLFIFAGNRLAVWGSSDGTSVEVKANISRDVQQGVVPSEEYVALKKMQHEGFKDPKKAKKTVKNFFKKHLKKFKEMDNAAKIIFIVLGIILLVVILIGIFFFIFVNEAANGCLEVSGGNSGGNTNDSSCCME